MINAKYRGKQLDTGEWIYGFYSGVNVYSTQPTEGSYIRDSSSNIWERVGPETVGQFTGMVDDSDREIYPGTVVICNGHTYVCKWNQYRCEWAWYWRGFSYAYPIGDMRKDIRVMGNIDDGPTLEDIEKLHRNRR